MAAKRATSRTRNAKAEEAVSPPESVAVASSDTPSVLTKLSSWGAKIFEPVKAHVPFAIATLGEFFALYFWLVFYDQSLYILASIVLFGGFLVERLAVLYWVKINFGSDVGIAAESKPLWKKALFIVLICLSEIVVWVLFVFAYDAYGIGAAFVVLLVGEQLEHSMELGLLAKRSWKTFLFTKSATMITILEALGGVLWLYLVRHGQPQLGGLMILTGLTVEHVVQGNAIKHKFLAERNTQPEVQPQEAVPAPGTQS